MVSLPETQRFACRNNSIGKPKDKKWNVKIPVGIIRHDHREKLYVEDFFKIEEQARARYHAGSFRLTGWMESSDR